MYVRKTRGRHVGERKERGDSRLPSPKELSRLMTWTHEALLRLDPTIRIYIGELMLFRSRLEGESNKDGSTVIASVMSL